MVLGKGLESLIPKHPFKKTQDDLGEIPQSENQREQTGDEKNLLSETSGGERARSEQQSYEVEPRKIADEGTSRGQASFLGHSAELSRSPGETQRVEGEDLFRPTKDEESIKGIVFQIETDKIAPNPHQPRRDFDDVALGELANSIREFGIIQPLIVSKIEKETARGWEVSYELVAGERRLLAAKILGLTTVPAIIRQVPVEHEKLELAVTENVQRSNLNPIELARAVARLQEEFKLTQREIATRLGKSREAVANSVRLLGLPSEMQEAVAAGKVSESQARLLLSVDEVAQREKLFQEVLIGNLTVREISSRVRRLKGKLEPGGADDEKIPIAGRTIDPELLALKERLETALGAPVELKKEGEGGKLTINFYSKEELEGILAKFKTPHQ